MRVCDFQRKAASGTIAGTNSTGVGTGPYENQDSGAPRRSGAWTAAKRRVVEAVAPVSNRAPGSMDIRATVVLELAADTGLAPGPWARPWEPLVDAMLVPSLLLSPAGR